MHFPELSEALPEGAAFTRLPAAEQQTKHDEAEAYRQKLLNMSEAELQQAIADGKQLYEKRYRQFRDAQLAKPFYDRITAEMDLNHWSRTAYWSLDEAAALSFGNDPRQVSQQKLRNLRQETRFCLDYTARLEILERAKAIGQLSNHTPLSRFLPWIERMRFPMPDALIQAAKALHGPEIDWKAKYHELHAEMVKRAEETGNDLNGAKAEEIAKSNAASLSARERESLLKLVIGMAIKGYAHDPHKSRTGTASEIATDLNFLGIPLSDDTIRSYLQEASELLPPPETEQKS